MATFGNFRIVRKKEPNAEWEIARDFVSASGLRLAFGSSIRWRNDYEIQPGFFETPEEAYANLLSITTIKKGK